MKILYFLAEKMYKSNNILYKEIIVCVYAAVQG